MRIKLSSDNTFAIDLNLLRMAQTVAAASAIGGYRYLGLANQEPESDTKTAGFVQVAAWMSAGPMLTRRIDPRCKLRAGVLLRHDVQVGMGQGRKADGPMAFAFQQRLGPEGRLGFDYDLEPHTHKALLSFDATLGRSWALPGWEKGVSLPNQLQMQNAGALLVGNKMYGSLMVSLNIML